MLILHLRIFTVLFALYTLIFDHTMRPLFITFVLSVLQAASSATIHCPIQGPEFPAPRKLSFSAFDQSGKETFVAQLKSGAVPTNTTALSVGVFSLDETEPLFEYHNSPSWVAMSKEGVKNIDSDTVYRIASVSKLYTVWLLLIKAGEGIFDDPITKHIPELAAAGNKNDSQYSNGSDGIDQVRWDEITVGDLARQMSGIIRERELLPDHHVVSTCHLMHYYSDVRGPKRRISTMDIHWIPYPIFIRISNMQRQCQYA